VPVCIAVNQVDEQTFVTPIGTFIGTSKLVQYDGEAKHVSRFFKIAYAKPPIGNLRFRRPEPFVYKKGEIYNTTKYGLHCIQSSIGNDFYTFDREQSEDCLHLNMYVPGRTVNTSNKYAVMIFIHGGSFAVGGGEIYNGDVLSAYNDVIVISINYRLDVLGFLSSGNPGDGNFGLWDMRAATMWVHENIKYFGGDNERVTLFGNSAGGAAVMYQALYPANRGLFQRIIAQSGSCFSGWALQRDAARIYKRLLKVVGCDKNTKNRRDFDTLRCLQKVPTRILKTVDLEQWFVPSVDDEFVPSNPAFLPYTSSKKSTEALKFFSEIDLMNGITSKDGSLSLIHVLKNETADTLYDTLRFEKKISDTTMWEFRKALSEPQIKQLLNHYSPNGKTTIANIIDFRTDLTFLVGAKYASKHHKSYHSLPGYGHNYFYVFDQLPSFAPTLANIDGVSHVYELPYIFGFPEALEHKFKRDYRSDSFNTTSKEGIQFSKVMMKLWSNFAKYG